VTKISQLKMTEMLQRIKTDVKYKVCLLVALTNDCDNVLSEEYLFAIKRCCYFLKYCPIKCVLKSLLSNW